MAEWLKAAVLKTVIGREIYLEFESLPLRGSTRFARSPLASGEKSEASFLFGEGAFIIVICLFVIDKRRISMGQIKKLAVIIILNFTRAGFCISKRQGWNLLRPRRCSRKSRTK